MPAPMPVPTVLKRISDLLAGLPATLVAGAFLVASFVLPRVGVALPVDPAWVTVVICGIPLLYLAVWRLVHNRGIGKITSVLLIDMAMLAAIGIGDLFAAGEVAFIMALGAILEDMTTNRAKKGLRQLISLAPTQGRLIEDGCERMVPAQDIRRGDVLRVLPGEAIPVDGTILSGATSVDQSIMTGESLPVDKGVGEEVYGGTINRFGSIDIAATRVGEDGSLQKMIRLVEEAETRQAPVQRVADRWATWLVPIVLLIAIATGLITHDIVRAVTVLVVFCPCALVLATPTAIMAAIGQATKHGVVIKSGEALERMGKVDTIAFDKTGTLTRGCLEVSDVRPFDVALGEEDLLRLAAAAEVRSEHPLGRAIVSSARERGLLVAEPSAFEIQVGRGVRARVDERNLTCGNEAFLRESGASVDEGAQAVLEGLRAEGKALVLVAEGSRCLGVVALFDALRPEAAAVVARLADQGVGCTLLTGDNRLAADYFARQVDIAEVCPELLPEEKVGAVERLQAQGRRVCMVGDGINDAPALKTASVGVAMGGMGSDIAVEAADITLMGDDISKVPYLKALANATVRTITFGITLSMCINCVAVGLSVAGVLTPTTGALVHNAGSLLVVLIAALLYDRKFDAELRIGA